MKLVYFPYEITPPNDLLLTKSKGQGKVILNNTVNNLIFHKTILLRCSNWPNNHFRQGLWEALYRYFLFLVHGFCLPLWDTDLMVYMYIVPTSKLSNDPINREIRMLTGNITLQDTLIALELFVCERTRPGKYYHHKYFCRLWTLVRSVFEG